MIDTLCKVQYNRPEVMRMAFDKSKYDMMYSRMNVIRKPVPFNKTKPEEMALLAWAESHGAFSSYVKRLIQEDMERARNAPKKTVEFSGSPYGNYMIVDNLYACIPVPEGASEDYGYLALRDAIVHMYVAHGGDVRELAFWYDGQESNLAQDASASEGLVTNDDFYRRT